MPMIPLQDIVNRDQRAAARLLRWIEDGVPEAQKMLKKLYPFTGRASVVGITGNPGVGKSTLVNNLIGCFRKQGKTVAVAAIDPSSPFSGGALLGDRIRMQEHATDDGVFIRSFATRGHLGGLTANITDIINAFDAMGYHVVLVETAGVGQTEVEIQRLAHTVVVVVTPGMGDGIQAIKAGILEIADIFVINKVDLVGADRTAGHLRQLLDLKGQTDMRGDVNGSAFYPLEQRVKVAGWSSPIIRTIGTSGYGIAELLTALDEHRSRYQALATDPEFMRRRLRQEFLELFRRLLLTRGWSYCMEEQRLNRIIDQLATHTQDPYTIAEQLIEAMLKQ